MRGLRRLRLLAEGFIRGIGSELSVATDSDHGLLTVGGFVIRKGATKEELFRKLEEHLALQPLFSGIISILAGIEQILNHIHEAKDLTSVQRAVESMMPRIQLLRNLLVAHASQRSPEEASRAL